CATGIGEKTQTPKSKHTGVTVNTTVRKTGQYPESFVLTFEEDIKEDDPDPSLFKLRGKAGFWGSNDTRDFECSFESAAISGNTLTLIPGDFPEKYFYVKEFTVDCKDHPEYGFTNSDITNIVTPIADDFTTVTNKDGINFDYHLFTPKDEKNMPVIIVFHGFGDTDNLLTYRTAVEWAEPDNQKLRPCYVLAPVIDDRTYYSPSGRDRVYDAIKDILDNMISEGKINPQKIYLMGNSFGGMATIEFCEKYPETASAAIALCPALTYAPDVYKKLESIKNLPIWFAHAKGDNTIPVSASQTAVSTLNELEAEEVRFTQYSDNEMDSAGADSAPDATYSYHHVELAVMEDDSYQEWLFDH
ncbi:MAG: hypothetical protein K6B28_06490, partial [Lachnospiraceae bacterium]|nr:hypothetical protein [Lachnospiraceae bacterium]